MPIKGLLVVQMHNFENMIPYTILPPVKFVDTDVLSSTDAASTSPSLTSPET